jgi:uncharacterized protein YjlB
MNVAEVEAIHLADDGAFPGSRLPALLYRGAFADSPSAGAPDQIEKTFHRNGWTAGWRDSVYDYHHYHSTAHEVLGCYRGRARVQLGGPAGPTLELAAGDVLLLPAGTAHKRLESSADFCVVGCYAEGREYDMMRGRPEERPAADSRIARCRRPRWIPSTAPLARSTATCPRANLARSTC